MNVMNGPLRCIGARALPGAVSVAVFPCKADKSPMTRRGFKDAVHRRAANPPLVWSQPGRPGRRAAGVKFDVLDLDLQHAGRGIGARVKAAAAGDQDTPHPVWWPASIVQANAGRQQ